MQDETELAQELAIEADEEVSSASPVVEDGPASLKQHSGKEMDAVELAGRYAIFWIAVISFVIGLFVQVLLEVDLFWYLVGAVGLAALGFAIPALQESTI